jgi:hypothetical protein
LPIEPRDLRDHPFRISLFSDNPLLVSGVDAPETIPFEPGLFLFLRDDVEAWVQENLDSDLQIVPDLFGGQTSFALVFASEEDFLSFNIRWIT